VTASFSQLLSPIKIAGMTLPNRMVMGAMHTRLETLDRPIERLSAFYARRAEGEIALILTGGYAPVPEGVMEDVAPLLNLSSQLQEHREIAAAVHRAGGRIVLQILHAGRYARTPLCVAPSEGKSRINIFAPRALSTQEVWDTVAAFAHTAALAYEAGYDGVEIMGSEGYLVNEFTAATTNQRTDEFGGSLENRIRFPHEIVKAVRAKVPASFAVIYRISSIDLVDNGMTGSEVAQYARAMELAGADMLNTGIGWHESGVPTIAASVPRAAWAHAVRNVKQAVGIPVMASNRINDPQVAEQLIRDGVADLVSMARPLLADPDFAKKTRLGRQDEINTCIACNQACLDRIFSEQTATCLVNPRAGRELDIPETKGASSRRIAVVGAGPAGLAFAINAADRGHRVTLFEASAQIGGQLNMAKRVPGKNEFNELIRYFSAQIKRTGIELKLSSRVRPEDLAQSGFDEVILATGVVPRIPEIRGLDHPKVLSYVDVLAKGVAVGQRVAILGAGGIGFDVAEYLLGDPEESLNIPVFMGSWGVDRTLQQPGGLIRPALPKGPARKIHMFQRKAESLGKNLGKTTGWILKARLRRAQVEMTGGVTYRQIDDQGLHYSVNGEDRIFEADHVVLCTGQLSNRSLADGLKQLGVRHQWIGGADQAAELDALRAIDQATRLAVSL
jgi:2,4-dienoyl-CoA reductase (NADPH2)